MTKYKTIDEWITKTNPSEAVLKQVKEIQEYCILKKLTLKYMDQSSKSVTIRLYYKGNHNIPGKDTVIKTTYGIHVNPTNIILTFSGITEKYDIYQSQTVIQL